MNVCLRSMYKAAENLWKMCLLQSVFHEGGSPEAAHAKWKDLGVAGNKDFISAFKKLVCTKRNKTPM